VEKQSLAIVGSGPTGTDGANALDLADYSTAALRFDTLVGESHPATARWRQAEEERLDRAFSERNPLGELMGPSRQVEKVRQQVAQVAGSPLTALIQGETGTGKELVARAIHHASLRRRKPFVAVDCGAIPETLIESELFGHEKGAFTGADQRKPGHFQLADGGSLLLDEIVNLPLVTQAKLLRALQERVVLPLGGRRAVPVDVRIIATSNLPLDQEMRAGRFRQDLYYRLNEFTITLPPLRERTEDVLYLANRFMAEGSLEFRRPIRGISEAASLILLRYHWPGNVRQLRSLIRQAVLLGRDGIQPEQLLGLCGETASAAPTVTDADLVAPGLKAIAAAAAADAERRAIRQALQASKGNKSAAARVLRIDYKTLQLKSKRYGICSHEFKSG